MDCRIDIAGRKIWIDNNNKSGARPSTVEIILYRDGEIYKTITLDSTGDGKYKFPCLIAWKDSKTRYEYTVDEAPVIGYSKRIQGYTITNTLNHTTIDGSKIWDDNHNAAGTRPDGITVSLFQNGKPFSTVYVSKPPTGMDISPYNFQNIPFADSNGTPFVYTVDESAAQGYKKNIDGFTITNTLITGGFSFIKTSIATGLSLQGATFELRQNSSLITTSASDASGKVSFSNLMPGIYQMTETVSPAGYMSNTDTYEVVVSSDGTVTIDGIPATEFYVKNTPEILIKRATGVMPSYMAAPNTWTLHGNGKSDLYMVDKILIMTEVVPVKVKWDYGVKDVPYFTAGGGYDVTVSYKNGIPAYTNDDYTVYLLFSNGYEIAVTITVDNIRDGSVVMPYLLIDYATADTLEPSVTGINQYILDFMQGDNSKLTKNYELYNNVDMSNKPWSPLGDTAALGFTGTFYGNGNDIKNMSITTSDGSTYNTGMFARVANGAVIEKLGLIDCTIENTRWNASGIIGFVAATDGSTTVLRDLRFSGSVTSNSIGSGILSTISAINGNILIDGCAADGTITGTSCGGIVGFSTIQTAGAVTITNCNTAGSCRSTGTQITNYAGGILGACSDTGNGQIKIEKCVNAMSVQSNAKSGGIIGTGSAAYTSTISSCLNLGGVTGVNQVGGIAGSFTDTNPTEMMIIENCYNTAKITATAVTTGYAGGIIGTCMSYVNVRNCYNTGDVLCSASGTQNIVGGISGNYGIISNCAAINSLCSSPQNSIARISQNTTSAAQSALNNNVAFENTQVLINGTAKSPLDLGGTATDGLSVTSSAIKTQALYETTLGWDFTNIWSFGNGAYTLPILRGIPANLQPTVLPPHLS